jgi:hypothetical protein
MARAKGKIPPGMRITRVPVVVKDLKKTMENYHRVMGWGPWSVYEHRPPVFHHTEVRGKPVKYTMLGAEVHCDPIDFEILQPLEGPSIYKEFLKEKAGIEVLMSGRLEGIEFYYMATDPVLKMVAETVSGHAISLKPSYTYP